MSFRKYNQEEQEMDPARRKKIEQAYRAKYDTDPTPSQFDSFSATYVATDGYGSSSSCDTSSSSDSGSSSFDGGCSSDGGGGF